MVGTVTTWRWIGGAGAADDRADWAIVTGHGNSSGLPQSGDTAIIGGASTVLLGINPHLSNNVFFLGNGQGQYAALGSQGDGSTSEASPTVDSQSIISNAVPGDSMPEFSLLAAGGTFVNAGTIIADGPAGSTFLVTVSDTVVNGTSQPGNFYNDGLMESDAGNTLDIEIYPSSELINRSEILAYGGSIVINAQPQASSGGYAGVPGALVISAGGSIETNASPSANATGLDPVYAFVDATPGNTLKIDNLSSFGGQILGFGPNDTIDLGTALSIGEITYIPTGGLGASSILLLQSSAGDILASLQIAGHFQSGTFAVSGGQADGITIATGDDGDTVLTTSVVQHDIYSNVSGAWQTAGAWSDGAVPGSQDTPFIGLASSSPFTLTSGNSPVRVAGLELVSQNASLEVTSAFSVTTFGIDDYAGNLEVTPGNTLTTSDLAVTSSSSLVTVDDGATLTLTGQRLVGLAAVDGVLTVQPGLTGGSYAPTVSADIYDGGTLQVAGNVQAINNSIIQIDEGGTIALSGGNVSAPTLNVLANGVLSGYGTVTGLANNSGTIEADQSGQTLEIDHGFGLMSLSSGATLQVDDSMSATATMDFSAGAPETLILKGGLSLSNDFTLANMHDGDRLEFGPGITATQASLSGTTLTVDLSGLNAPGSSVTFSNVINSAANFFTTGIDSSTGDSYVQVACYCRGTLIATESGDMPVERLAIGDAVVTASGMLRPIKWIGTRSYGGRFIIGRKDILPICFKAGSLGEGLPRRDLFISPHHAMYLGGILIEARDLANGVSIVQVERVDDVEYFHIELATHDVIIAEGAPSESFVDDDSRAMFHNAHEFRARYPDAPDHPAQYCAPRRSRGYDVEAVRADIAERAGLRPAEQDALRLRGCVEALSARRIAGWAQNPDHPEAPVCLDIYDDGRLIGQVLANVSREDLARAGIGNGRHGFEFRLPQRLGLSPGTIEVRRSIDGAVLKPSRRAISPQLSRREARHPSLAAG